jgi:hypothetical protein
MGADEQKIIKQYIRAAYDNLKSVRLLNEQPRSERFPMVSQEEVAAQHEFDILCMLARDLGISNPWEDARFNILTVED